MLCVCRCDCMCVCVCLGRLVFTWRISRVSQTICALCFACFAHFSSLAFACCCLFLFLRIPCKQLKLEKRVYHGFNGYFIVASDRIFDIIYLLSYLLLVTFTGYFHAHENSHIYPKIENSDLFVSIKPLYILEGIQRSLVAFHEIFNTFSCSKRKSFIFPICIYTWRTHKWKCEKL